MEAGFTEHVRSDSKYGLCAASSSTLELISAASPAQPATMAMRPIPPCAVALVRSASS